MEPRSNYLSDDEQKVKTDQIPANAHHLYIQLYCKRKGKKDKKTKQEAKKSWASLSISKKKLFNKTTAHRNLIDYAYGLSKSKIYLKQKLCNPQRRNKDLAKESEPQETVAPIDESFITENRTHPREVNEFINDRTKNANEIQEDNTESHETQADVGRSISEYSPSNCRNETMLEDADATQEPNAGNPLRDPIPCNQVDEIQDALETQSTISSIQRITVPLAEPTPPTIKLGKDLYEIIKRPGTAEWKTLSKKEKSHYNAAVRTIKREYIKNYTKYLESLTQQQLFDHYIKTLH